ncbi:hypothetical protein CU006_2619 [Enterococcus faecium]|nr:hypothetical protein [Enterococcus faecium]
MSLKAARVNAGFTSKEAAKAADVHFQTLSKYEKDSSDIPFSLLNERLICIKFLLTIFFWAKSTL